MNILQWCVRNLVLVQGGAAIALGGAAEYFTDAGIPARIDAALFGAGIADALAIVAATVLVILFDDAQEDGGGVFAAAANVFIVHASASLAAILAVFSVKVGADIFAGVFVLFAVALTLVCAMQARVSRKVRGPLWLYVLLALPLALGVIVGDAVLAIRLRASPIRKA